MFNGALPSGGVELGHVPLVLARGIWLVALFSGVGGLLFRAAAPADAVLAPAVRQRLARLILGSLLAAALVWVVWVVLQAAAIAGAGSFADAVAALGPVFTRAAFGHRAAAQILLVLLALATLRLGRVVPAVPALAALALQAGHSHAWAMDGGPSLLTGAVLLHLCAGAAWLGGLAPLGIVVRHAPLAAARATVARFSRIATGLVLVLAATVLVQAYWLLGGVPGVFGTSYGLVALGKAALFAVLLGFALRNRLRFAPALATGRAALARSIAGETAVGAVVVLAAALLSTLPPGMHTQAAWPFTWRPPLPLPPGAWVAGALAGLAVASLLVATGWPRLRRRAVAAAVAGILLAGGALARVLVPATPTSFYHSETGYTAASIADGATRFAADCAACHAAGSPAPARLAALNDGDLFWAVGGGTPAHRFAQADDDARWHLVDFLRARAGAGVLPARAPDMDVTCADGNSLELSDFRGNVLRVVFGPAPPEQLPPGVPAITLLVQGEPPAPLAPGACAVSDGQARAAFAVVTGLAPAALDGLGLVIDKAGWLRAILPANAAPGALAAALRQVNQPI